MTQLSPPEKKNSLKKRTDAFSKFLSCRKKHADRAKGIREELEKANGEMLRLADKFNWWGTLP
jgi:hypothetical protein